MTDRNGDILRSVHQSARALHDAGVLDRTTLRDFDALCLPQVPAYSAGEIKALRRRLQVSQPVLAAYLGVTKSTVAQWERGAKAPRGPALRLLDLADRKGLDALV
jgi:putative transcriptional regulator